MTNELAHRGLQFLKRETVLCAAVLLAVISCFFVAPGLSYLSYIDWNTLALLFSLMAVMKGLQQANFFVCLADILLRRVRTTRALLFLLIFLPFVFSMVITNDVALIAFVPFGLTVLHLVDQDRLAVPQVVLQTLAANLGSMLTPMGNPQNLYIYNASGLSFTGFCAILLPYVLAAGVFLLLAIFLIRPAAISPALLPGGAESRELSDVRLGAPQDLCLYGAGFVLCLLALFKVLSPLIIALAFAAFFFFYDRKLLAAIDYSLLATFMAFFIFVGNVAAIGPVRAFLASVLEGHVELISIICSQAISNVPAALLLSGFTFQWPSLLIGCNLGGLGTLVASMASLISYKLLVQEYPQQRMRYLGLFTFLNLLFLGLLYTMSVILRS